MYEYCNDPKAKKKQKKHNHNSILLNATITECLSVLKSHDALVVIILIMMILIMVIMIMIIPIVMIMIIVMTMLMRGRGLLLVCTIAAACQGFSLPKRLQPYIIILCRFK